MSIGRSLLFIVLCGFYAVKVQGQAARSPFTTIGIGETYGSALINSQAMGGVGVAQPQIWHLNNQNPALLPFNTMTVFQAGILGERRIIRQDTSSEKSVGGNMSYLAIAFPVKITKWTTSLGLMPYTTVNYKIAYIGDIINSTDSTVVTEQGSGGLSQLYWSNGIRITRHFNVGLKAAYIFGSTTNKYSNILLRSRQTLNLFSTVQDKSYVQDFAFTGGISYSLDSLFKRKRYRMSFGATYSAAANLKTRLRSEIYRSNSIGTTVNQDTLYTVKGNTYIPASWALGVALARGTKWSIATELSMQDWSKFKSLNQDEETMTNSWRFGLGGEITPDAGSEKFFKRVIYRAGFSAEQYPFLANNTNVKDVGINFGFSLPAGRSSLDFAFKYGKRGNKDTNLLEENYFKLYFGITFNDNSWFIKRKFD